MRSLVSLFSGCGGFDLGLERAGLRTVVQVELDRACRRVLEARFPKVARYYDVRSVGKRCLPERPFALAGGFPCQDLSSANNTGKGLEGERSKLWFEMRRIAEEIEPSLVLVENVTSGEGRWLPYVRRDLHLLGYRTLAFRLGAGDLGALHRRTRTFVIAADPRRFRLAHPARWSGWSDAPDPHRNGQHAPAEHAEVGGAPAAARSDDAPDADRNALRVEQGWGERASFVQASTRCSRRSSPPSHTIDR